MNAPIVVSSSARTICARIADITMGARSSQSASKIILAGELV
jgi:hypothetical protein